MVLLGVVITERHPDRGILPRDLVPGVRDKSVLVKEGHAAGGGLIAIIVVEGGRASCSSLIIPVFNHFGLAKGSVPFGFSIRVRILVFTGGSRERDNRPSWGLLCPSSSTAADPGQSWREPFAGAAAEDARTKRPNALPPLETTVDQTLTHRAPGRGAHQQGERNRRGLRDRSERKAMQHFRSGASTRRRAAQVDAGLQHSHQELIET